MNFIKQVTAPFYAKLALVLVSLISLGYVAVLGKQILAPLFFSLLFSILLLPVAGFLEKKCRLPRSGAAILSVLLLLAGIATIIYTVGSQMTNLAQDWPMFQHQVIAAINGLQHWVTLTFHVNVNRQMTYINEAASSMLSASTSVIGTTLLSLSSIMLFLVFVMIDTFFLLFYRRLIIKFLIAVFREENSVMVYDIVEQVQSIIRQYILGLLLEMAIVSVAGCLAFWILGIKYAFLLGLLTGLLNIIPYIGIFTALLISTMITIATVAVASKVLLVIVTILGIHLIDSNVLLPLVVGSKVKINAFITLLGVIIGEKLWGIPGMFLAIPVIAICKIIFDRIETLKPWGLLLGDEKDEKHPGKLKKKITQEAEKGNEDGEEIMADSKSPTMGEV